VASVPLLALALAGFALAAARLVTVAFAVLIGLAIVLVSSIPRKTATTGVR
jgi:hypothetical protein